MNIFLFFFLFLFGFVISHIERKYYIPHIKWVFIIPFCILISNRNIKVPDTQAYFDFFENTDLSLDDLDKSGFEIGFQVLTKIIKYIDNDNFSIYLGIITLLNLLIINFASNKIGNIFKIEQKKNDTDLIFIGNNRFFKNSYFSVIPLMLYVAYYGIYNNAIVLRVGLAISLLVLSVSYVLKENKNTQDYIKIISLFILGYYFHATMLIGALVVIIIYSKIFFSKNTYLWIWFSIGIIYFFNVTDRLGSSAFSFVTSLNELSLLATKMSSYDGNVVQQIGGISNKFVFYWVMALFLILHNFNSRIFIKLLNVYLIGLFIFALLRSVILIERVTDFFLIFSFIIYYLFLIMQKTHRFWLFFIPIVIIQLIFVFRITN